MNYRVREKMKWGMKWMTRTKQNEGVTDEGQMGRVINMWFKEGKIIKRLTCSPTCTAGPPTCFIRGSLQGMSVSRSHLISCIMKHSRISVIHCIIWGIGRKGRPRSMWLGKDGVVWNGKVVCMKNSRKDLRKCLCRVTDATTSNTYSC